MKLLTLFLTLTLSSAVVAQTDQRKLDHAVGALNMQLETLNFVADSRVSNGLNHRFSNRDYQRIVDASFHIQEDLIIAVDAYKRTRNVVAFRQQLREIQSDLMNLTAFLGRFGDRSFSAASTLLVDIWGYFKQLIGQGYQAPPVSAVCSIRHSSAFFPSTTISCTEIPKHIVGWRLTWGDLSHRQVKTGQITAGAGTFQKNVGRIGASYNRYTLELIDKQGRAAIVPMQGQ